jgi:hypothetical protein
MAKKKKRGGFRRKSSGGRFGIDANQTMISAGASWLGTKVKGMLPAGTPTFITNAAPEALGLFTAGVIFKDKAIRSCGVGLAFGSALGAVTP